METESLSFKCLGTDVYVKVVFSSQDKKKDEVKKILGKVRKIYREYHLRLSRFDSGSEVSLLNSGIGNWQNVSNEISHLLERMIFRNEKTGGIFDPRIISELEVRGYDKDFSLVKDEPSKEGDMEINFFEKPLKDEILFQGQKVKVLRKIDFTGIAKGYITDRVVDFLKNEDLENFLVDSGGDIFCCGKNDREVDWLVSLEGYPEDKLLISLSDRAIATSGVSRRRWHFAGKEVHHLIDPRNLNKSDFNLRSVSVVGESVEEVDVWAKTLFILGLKDGMELAEKNRMAAFFLDARGNLHITRTSKSFIKTA